MTGTPVFSRVHIIGTGLLGTSIGLALIEQGTSVTLADQSPSRAALAAEYGAGVVSSSPEAVECVIVATPPDVTAQVATQSLQDFPDALVIDVASVKSGIIAEVSAHPEAGTRFVGTHPMAGREKGGPTQARVDLFTGRPWVICPTSETPETLTDRVSQLIRSLGATVHTMSPTEHDQAVAIVSHLPQLVSSVLAAGLTDAPSEALSLAGQGLRDMTRIASSDHELWSQILQHNAEALRGALAVLRTQLDRVESAVADAEDSGSLRGLAEVLQAGAEGAARIPGKHGGSARFATLTVVIDDRPGQLAALLTDVGDLGVNLEDMGLEHSPGAPVGFVALSVLPDAAEGLATDLASRGWRIAGESQ